MPTPQATLQELLVAALSAGELRRLVGGLEDGRLLLAELPSGGALAQLAFETVGLLERRGRIDAAFFEALHRALGRGRAAEVTEVARVWLGEAWSLPELGKDGAEKERRGPGSRGQVKTAPVPTGQASWDLFLAYAGPDQARAKELRELLGGEAAVFFAAESVQLGDDWDRTIASAQRASRVTVVLVSESTDEAYYQREEVAAAVAMARDAGSKHRVVPLYLDGWPSERCGVPYGLRLKHGLVVDDTLSLEEAARRLRALVRRPAVHAPRRCGEWTLGVELGRGGYGVVYEATAPDGAMAAVKVLHHPAGADPQERARRRKRLDRGDRKSVV